MTFSRLCLLVLLFALPCPVQCTSLTFGQALELALNRSGYSHGSEDARSPISTESRGQTTDKLFCPLSLQNYAGLADKLAIANLWGLPPEGPILSANPVPNPAEPSVGTFYLHSSKNVILCTALVYAKLEGIQAQQRILREQQEYVRRLLDIESQRVSVAVDHPLQLTEAKQWRARTRLEAVTLNASERKMRSALSTLVGIPTNPVDPVDGSMPALPDRLPATGDNLEVFQQLMAYRDIVQLDYVSEFISRFRVTHDMELAKASIGDLVEAHIREEIKLIALLQLNDQIRSAKIQFIAASDELEAWAFGHTITKGNQPPSSPITLEVKPSAPIGSLASNAATPSLQSILVSPALKQLPVGRSQQYSAIATYSNGRVKDITSEADWSSSNEINAILSTTGLLTGISPGETAIRVEFQGFTHSRKVAITEQPADEYLLPKH